ncbi:RNA-directed DNA polymerase, eukaryota [Artemisia annua]|uniref:RNA-directed DNA polymerase, eukaryota n=1 Tax=Artemisia annua TaxID=35608 RepID=A0A2U1N0Z0_ARTAN|nr:RNA-directed DNA polymerase, eukaryota [Artemisia annua]
MERRPKIILEHIQSRITKFFITNLPDRCSGNDLAQFVREYGQIFDLYIARKRDKRGNRFGFISILDVKDNDDLLKSLRKIRMGDFHLWFNVARFVLEDGEINHNNVEKRNTDTYPKSNRHVERVYGEAKKPVFEVGKRSFMDTLVGKKMDTFHGKSVRVDDAINAFESLHKRAIIARMVDLEALRNVKVIIHELCPSSGKVQYLGGLDVLISYEDEEIALAVCEAAKSMVESFSNINIWEGQVVGFERLAWLKVQGIPLNLLTNEVIDMVGGLFGKVVHKANRSECDGDLSYEYMGVLVGDGKRVSEEVVLHWKDRRFRVWVLEELGEWIPDFTVETKHSPDIGKEDSDPVSKETPEKMDGGSDGFSQSAGGNSNGTINVKVNETFTDYHSSPLNDTVMQDNRKEFDGFIPAINFPFEQFLGDNGAQSVTKNVNKRKKFKKGSGRGRPSKSYSSSQESLKVVKKSKTSKNDPFGLNGLLGLNDETEESAQDCNNSVEVVNDTIEVENNNVSIDLNSVPDGQTYDNNAQKGGSHLPEQAIDDNSAEPNTEVNENVQPPVHPLIKRLMIIVQSLILLRLKLLRLWEVFKKDSVVKDGNFLCTSGLLTDGARRLNIINVYAPQQNVEKRRLWRRLTDIIQIGQGWWIVMGDFNAVRYPEERKNSIFDPVCARDFNDFIDDTALQEYNLKGMKFTYLANRLGACKLSRIDRVLVCSNVFNKWPNACVRALQRDMSDHSPLILSLVDTNFGPKPFRWFDSWLERTDCIQVINSVLVGVRFRGPADVVLGLKLKTLRNKLKIWSKNCRL